ncbi:hypothetical protein [Actinoplanes sp. M2I2]|uniref:hypothetical protein n=1 Tax=Actinoplanes sp. M2I2 TaxID=1734444 RepID=UPI0020203742|nr:hypothetical protein [Actinoplanes sp. M2I2]
MNIRLAVVLGLLGLTRPVLSVVGAYDDGPLAKPVGPLLHCARVDRLGRGGGDRQAGQAGADDDGRPRVRDRRHPAGQDHASDGLTWPVQLFDKSTAMLSRFSFRPAELE